MGLICFIFVGSNLLFYGFMTVDQLQYLKTHITSINGGVKFDTKNTTDGEVLFGSITDLKTFLKANFVLRLADPKFNQELIREFRSKDFVAAKTVEIANKYLIYKSDLDSYYKSIFQSSLLDEVNKDAYITNSLKFIEASVANKKQFGYTKTSLKKILEKQYDFIFSNGFPSNLLNINTGIMTANAGDSAQFLFLARAILAGFNCSNVDVRSSRYDAVVDFNNTLLRLQIKGVSSGNSISFKDRDRGGQGIDHKHQRNLGQRITAADCDIYVAVDKEVGICYLIPMSYVDTLDIDAIKSVKLSSLTRYKENWAIISEVANAKLSR